MQKVENQVGLDPLEVVGRLNLKLREENLEKEKPKFRGSLKKLAKELNMKRSGKRKRIKHFH